MLTGHHFQNAYVTRNVDKAVAQFREQADVRTLSEIEVPVQLWTCLLYTSPSPRDS